MKRLICVLLTLALLFSLTGCGSAATQEPAAASPAAQTEVTPAPAPEPAPKPTADPNQPIAFADAAFESGVRKALNKPTGDITIAEAAAVNSLNLELPGDDWSIPRIANLSDVQYFPNLTSLFLGWALYKEGGVDITPLTSLTNLEGLYMPCTTIKDIGPLAALTKLQELQIWGTRNITDLTPLAGMTELRSLWISDNLISDVSPLANLQKLEWLNIEKNMVTDVSPLAGLKNLKSLFLADNPIHDYTPLSDIFPSLTDKDFELLDHSLPIAFSSPALEKAVRKAMGVPKGDITPEMTEGVTELCLGNAFDAKIPDEDKVAELNSLRYFPNLMKLELQFNNISDNVSYLAVLGGLPGLKILDLNGNSLHTCYELAGCKQLEFLNIAGFVGNDLHSLTPLKGLKTLILSYSPQIRDLGPLSELTSLEDLRLESVMIDDYSPLAGLKNLKTLYIAQGEGYNPDLSPLVGIYPSLTDRNFEMK